jgi:hypothetical protein
LIEVIYYLLQGTTAVFMTTKVTVKKPTGEARRYRQIGPNSNGWQGYFLAEGKKVNVGTFATQEEAAKERDR